MTSSFEQLRVQWIYCTPAFYIPGVVRKASKDHDADWRDLYLVYEQFRSGPRYIA
jgi:hypothetical protein